LQVLKSFHTFNSTLHKKIQFKNQLLFYEEGSPVLLFSTLTFIIFFTKQVPVTYHGVLIEQRRKKMKKTILKKQSRI